MQILITGIAGFIGSYTAKKLVEAGYLVQGIDNFSNYYSVEYKKARVKDILDPLQIDLIDLNIEDSFKVNEFIKKARKDAKH